MKDFKCKTIGRCLREYSHPLYDTLVLDCDHFIVTDCEMAKPTGQRSDKPRCGANQYMYGFVSDVGFYVLLKYIIDSSD
jgi:hypothetical protein